MEHRFCVHPLKFAASSATALCFFIISWYLLVLGRWGSAAIFICIAVLFSVVAVFCGSIIHFDSTRVWRTILGIKTKELYWSDISEVGVIGTKVFNQQHPERTGSMYIYFSKQPLGPDDRFHMMLKWPPLDKIHLLYKQKRMDAVQMIWNSKVETYNTNHMTF